MFRHVLLTAAFLIPAAAYSAPQINEEYIKSLASPDKVALVVEYRDNKNHVVSRQGFSSETGFKAVSATEIQVSKKVKLRLFGVKPCQGNIRVESDNFSGSCSAYAQQQLDIQLKNPKVIFCVSYVAEQNAPTQDASCWGYWYFPGSLDTVSSIEEQLLSVGALTLASSADGKLYRPDLVGAEAIGRKGYGLWSDKRFSTQDVK